MRKFIVFSKPIFAQEFSNGPLIFTIKTTPRELNRLHLLELKIVGCNKDKEPVS